MTDADAVPVAWREIARFSRPRLIIHGTIYVAFAAFFAFGTFLMGRDALAEENWSLLAVAACGVLLVIACCRPGVRRLLVGFGRPRVIQSNATHLRMSYVMDHGPLMGAVIEDWLQYKWQDVKAIGTYTFRYGGIPIRRQLRISLLKGGASLDLFPYGDHADDIAERLRRADPRGTA